MLILNAKTIVRNVKDVLKTVHSLFFFGLQRI